MILKEIYSQTEFNLLRDCLKQQNIFKHKHSSHQLKMHVNCPPWLEKIWNLLNSIGWTCPQIAHHGWRKFGIYLSQLAEHALILPAMVGENLEFTYLNWLNMPSNCPPWLEKIWNLLNSIGWTCPQIAHHGWRKFGIYLTQLAEHALNIVRHGWRKFGIYLSQLAEHALILSAMVGENLEFTYLNWLNMPLYCPPWLEKIWNLLISIGWTCPYIVRHGWRKFGIYLSQLAEPKTKILPDPTSISLTFG